MSKASVNLPKGIDCFGGWITLGKGDVHAYVNRDCGAVIGHNANDSKQEPFSDRALVIEPGGKVSFQCKGADGQAIIKDVPPGVAAERIKAFLDGFVGLFE